MKSNASKQAFAKRKKELLKWEKIKEEKGVMVAASKEIEWLLPWWWKNYSYTNFYPVLFVDFGMTVEAKKWCQERGQLITLPKLPKGFVASKKQIDPELLEKWKFFLKKSYSFYLVRRSFFFKKPLAFLKTIFKKTIWIDLDCLVLASIKPLFDLPIKDTIGCCKNPIATQIKYHKAGLQKKDESIYNGGIIIYNHRTELLTKLAKATFDKNRFFCCDDFLLSYLICQEKVPVVEVPLIYNWFYNWGANPEAKIIHCLGPKGKRLIREMIKKLSQRSFIHAESSFKECILINPNFPVF